MHHNLHVWVWTSYIIQGIFDFTSRSCQSMLSWLTIVFYSPIQYRVAKQYIHIVPVILTAQLHPSGWHVDLQLKANNSWIFKVTQEWPTWPNKRRCGCSTYLKHTLTPAFPSLCHSVDFYISTNWMQSSSTPWTKPLCVSMQLQLPRCPTRMHDLVWRGWRIQP